VGSGKYIIIDHKNGYKTRYSQLDSILVQKGQSVQTGQTIARVGSSGRSTGPHLHFEILYHEKPVNPEDYIQF
jgi:murein DD-endopeptidase MepM/ murein hydrolase activator NlpD